MNQMFLTASVGMMAEHDHIEQLEQDIAAYDVVGYKKSDQRFVEMTDHGRNLGPVLAEKTINFNQGRMMKTGGPFDMMIDGQGLFKVVDDHGDVLYTRNGEFHRDPATGKVVNFDGYHLEGVTIPASATHVHVDGAGRVFADLPVEKNHLCGQVMIAVFPTPELLRQVSGGNMFKPTLYSGSPKMLKPNGDRDGTGNIRFGFVERANQGLIQPMMEMLMAQRYFEANSKGMQVADELLHIANGLIR